MLIFIAAYLPKADISSDVYDLIPASGTLGEVEDHYIAQLNRTVLVAIRGSQKDIRSFENKIDGLPGIESIISNVDLESQNFEELLVKYPYSLISEETRKLLHKPASYARWILAQLYSPVGGVSEKELEADPLLLTRQFFITHPSKLKTKDGYLTSTDLNGQDWKLLFITLKPSLSSEETIALANTLTSIQRSYNVPKEGKEVVFQGALFYTNYAHELARNDIVRLGTISAILLVLLIWTAFKSIFPIFLCLISVIAGSIVGISSSFLVFGGIHVIAVVMCLSLVGLATDYTTYYITALRNRNANATSFTVMQHLRPVLWHAVLTTAIAYGLMIFAPFPGLRQMAIFAVCGLLASCLTVILWFPYLCKNISRLPIGRTSVLQRYISLWKNKKFITCLFSAFALFVVIGISHLRLSDNLADLQAMPENLTSQEQIIKSLLNQDFSQNWVLVKANNSKELINKLEQVRGVAEKSSKEVALPPLRSRAIQEEIYKDALHTAPIVKQRLEEVDMETGSLQNLNPLSWETFLESAMGEPYKKMFFQDKGTSYFLIQVNPDEIEFLQEVRNLPDVQILNKRLEIETIFHHYREMVLVLLSLSFIVILCTLSIQFGWKIGWRAGISLAISVLSGIAILGWTDNPLNLFSAFALIPIIGVGVDYLVVFIHLKNQPIQVLFSLVVALLSTMISLGILVLSKTSAIENFGLVLCAGIITAFITAPLVITVPNHN
ncbi:MAG: MMPL family transporter [Burkholderiales bacterium]|nr:MMPL family transporter [Burkholderiales bacterium]